MKKNLTKKQIAKNAHKLIEGFIPSLYQKIDQMDKELENFEFLTDAQIQNNPSKKGFNGHNYMCQLYNSMYDIDKAKLAVDALSNELRNLYETIKKLSDNFFKGSDMARKMAEKWFREDFTEAKDKDMFFHFVNENFDEIFYDEFLKYELVDPRDIEVFTKKAKELFEKSYEEYVEACNEKREKHFTKNKFKEENDWQSYVEVYDVKNGGIVPIDYIRIF